MTAKHVLALVLAALPAFAAAQEATAPAPRERTVYVPIEDFDQIFAKQRGGVFVPYEELRALVRRARAAERPRPIPRDPAPPADYLLVGVDLRGQAGEGVAHFEATFDVEVLRDDRWVVVPVGLGEAFLESVEAGEGQQVAVGPLDLLTPPVPAPPRRKRRGPAPTAAPVPAQAGYGLVVRGAGRVRTKARFAVPVTTRPGRSSFSLTLPRTALARFEVTLPESGLAVNVEDGEGRPLATEVRSLDERDQTHVRAYFGAGAQTRVTWNPRPKDAGGDARAPLLFARTETALRLDEGVVQTTTRVDYRILQAPCGEFVLRFPKGYTLLGLQGENMSSYPVPTERDGQQEIVVRLHEPAEKHYALELRLERILAEGTGAVPFPRVTTVGTERESGVLAARTSEFLTLEPARFRGLSQIDASQASETLARDLGWDRKARPPVVFRYLRQPYELILKTTPIEPEVDGQVFALASIRDNEVELNARVRYRVRKRGIFGVRVALPHGLRVLQCGDERTVKDWRVEKDAEGGEVLVVDFVGQVGPGRFDLPLLGQLVREQAQPDEGEVVVRLPRFRLLGVRKETGVLAVGAPSHLEVSLVKEKLRGLLPEGVRKLAALGFDRRPVRGEAISQGFKYLRPEDVSAEFSVRKRDAKVTAAVETLVDAQEDKVRVTTTVRYTVEYAGIEQVRIEVPAALGNKKELRFEREGLKDQRVRVEGDRAVWTIGLQGKKIGTFPVRFTYDVKLDDLAAGSSRDVTLHEVKVLDCFSETGDIALKKHENLVVTELEMDSLEKRDKRELPAALRRQGPIQAYRYVSHPHRLTLRITKYDFKAPLGILVQHLHQDEVIGRDGRLKAEAVLLLQNNAEQYITVLLPPGAVMQGLKVDGQTREWSEGVEHEGRPSVQVHLGEATKVRRDRPFQIAIRYDLEGGGPLAGLGSLELHTLRFPLQGGEEVPVARLTRRLYLPAGFKYMEFDTDATKHFLELSLWEELKSAFGVRTGRESLTASPWTPPWQAGKRAAEEAIDELRKVAGGDDDGGIYPALALPLAQEPYLFEKLDNPSRLRVRYASWSAFVLVDLLACVFAVALGLFLTGRGVLGAASYTALAAGLAALGAVFLGRAVDAYCFSALLGSLGLGAFFLGQAVWRELTVVRHQRRLAELAKEERLARARAEAAEAEARLRASRASASASATAPTQEPKAKGAPDAEARAAAERIRFEDVDATGEAPVPSAEGGPSAPAGIDAPAAEAEPGSAGGSPASGPSSAEESSDPSAADGAPGAEGGPR